MAKGSLQTRASPDPETGRVPLVGPKSPQCPEKRVKGGVRGQRCGHGGRDWGHGPTEATLRWGEDHGRLQRPEKVRKWSLPCSLQKEPALPHLMLAFCPQHPWEERCLRPLLPGSLLQRSRKSHPAPGVLMLRHPERLEARAPPPPNLRLSSRGLFCGAETGASA